MGSQVIFLEMPLLNFFFFPLTCSFCVLLLDFEFLSKKIRNRVPFPVEVKPFWNYNHEDLVQEYNSGSSTINLRQPIHQLCGYINELNSGHHCRCGALTTYKKTWMFFFDSGEDKLYISLPIRYDNRNVLLYFVFAFYVEFLYKDFKPTVREIPKPDEYDQ